MKRYRMFVEFDVDGGDVRKVDDTLIRRTSEFLSGQVMDPHSAPWNVRVELEEWNTPLYELDLPVRAMTVLTRHNIETAQQLAELTVDDLYAMRNLGFKMVDVIQAALAIEGMHLKKSDGLGNA